MKQDIYNGMKLVNGNVDQMPVFVVLNDIGIKINADVNVKNYLTKEYVIKDLFRIPVIVTVNVINYIMFESIQIIKTVSVERN